MGEQENKSYWFGRKEANSVSISGKLQMTEYGKQLLAQNIVHDPPDAVHAEYTRDDGVKYAGTLYRVDTKDQ